MNHPPDATPKQLSAATTSTGLATPQRSLITLARDSLRAAWLLRPVQPPQIAPDLTSLPALERSAEVLRYSLLGLEYALSSGGGLRAWLKLNLLITIVLATPAVFLTPVITWLCISLATWTVYLQQAATNLLHALLAVVAIAVICTALLFLFRRCR